MSLKAKAEPAHSLMVPPTVYGCEHCVAKADGKIQGADALDCQDHARGGGTWEHGKPPTSLDMEAVCPAWAHRENAGFLAKDRKVSKVEGGGIGGGPNARRPDQETRGCDDGAPWTPLSHLRLCQESEPVRRDTRNARHASRERLLRRPTVPREVVTCVPASYPRILSVAYKTLAAAPVRALARRGGPSPPRTRAVALGVAISAVRRCRRELKLNCI